MVRVDEDTVRVQVAARPIEGAANEALLRFLAREVLGVGVAAVQLIRGQTHRDKVVAVHADADVVLAALRRAASSSERA